MNLSRIRWGNAVGRSAGILLVRVCFLALAKAQDSGALGSYVARHDGRSAFFPQILPPG